jgi:hypothetical protein
MRNVDSVDIGLLDESLGCIVETWILKVRADSFLVDHVAVKVAYAMFSAKWFVTAHE